MHNILPDQADHRARLSAAATNKPASLPSSSRFMKDAAEGTTPKRIKPTITALPRYGPDAASQDRLEQSHTLEIRQIDAAPMFARRTDAKR